MLSAAQVALLKAICGPEEAAQSCWQEWRKLANLDQLDSLSFFALPLLGAKIGPWLQDDSQRAVLMGIIKQAWSANQVQFRLLSEAVRVFREISIEPLVIGQAASALTRPAGATFRVSKLEILVPPAAIPMLRGNINVRTSCLSSPADLCSEASALNSRTTYAGWSDFAFVVPPVEWQLVEVLARPRPPGDLTWVCEAMLAIQQPALDWERFNEHLAICAEAPRAIARLRRVTEHFPTLGPASGYRIPRWRRTRGLLRDYRSWRSQARDTEGLSFGRYLQLRWSVPSLLGVPRVGLQVLLRAARNSS